MDKKDINWTSVGDYMTFDKEKVYKGKERDGNVSVMEGFQFNWKKGTQNVQTGYCVKQSSCLLRIFY